MSRRQLSMTPAAIRKRQQRAAETPEQREARLQAVREQAKRKRNAERTASENEAWLEANRLQVTNRRRNETSEKHQQRLQASQQQIAARRNNESEQQREQRLAADRLQHRRARAGTAALYRAAVVGSENETEGMPHDLGPMNIVCKYNFCRALHFQAEKAKLLHSCCHTGKIASPPLSPYPDQLRILLTGNTMESRNFREFIRQYNSANAFASFGAKMPKIPGTGPYCFKISGEIYHLATSVLVENSEGANDTPRPKYGQLFIYDPNAAVEYRMHREENAECDRKTMEIIDQVMGQVNPYVQQYRRLHQLIIQDDRRPLPRREYELRLVRNPRDDQRRYNAPVTNRECMYLIESAEGDVPVMDLAVHPIHQRGCTRISPYSRHVDPMVFPIFFPHGDSGFYIVVFKMLTDRHFCNRAMLTRRWNAETITYALSFFRELSFILENLCDRHKSIKYSNYVRACVSV
jgi:hypothetical protein